jgi:hypothetical protein
MARSVPTGASHLLVAGCAQVAQVAQLAVHTVPDAPCAERELPQRIAQRELELDDVIDFHALLSSDAWFDRLVQVGHSPDGQRL